MPVDENKATILRYLDIINEGLHNYHLVVHPEVTGIDGDEPVSGIGHFIRISRAFRAAIPDLHFAADQILAEGDWVALLFTASGTPQEPLWGVPPTGKRFQFTGQAMYRVEHGLIRQALVHWDMLGLLKQIGAGPTFSNVARTAP